MTSWLLVELSLLWLLWSNSSAHVVLCRNSKSSVIVGQPTSKNQFIVAFNCVTQEFRRGNKYIAKCRESVEFVAALEINHANAKQQSAWVNKMMTLKRSVCACIYFFLTLTIQIGDHNWIGNFCHWSPTSGYAINSSYHDWFMTWTMQHGNMNGVKWCGRQHETPN